jgi:hypothetical protein
MVVSLEIKRHCDHMGWPIVRLFARIKQGVAPQAFTSLSNLGCPTLAVQSCRSVKANGGLIR